MNRLGLRLIITALFILIVSANIHAANRVVYENFDDKDVDSPFYIGQGSINGYVTGRSGSGYAAQLSQTSYGEPDNTICYQPGSWTTNEIYISYWMRYPSYTGRGKKKADGSYSTQWNNKLFYMHINMSGNYVSTVMDGGSWLHTSVKPGNYYYNYGVSNMVDGNWHHYEWYINLATGKVKVWIDGGLKIDKNHSGIDWPTGSIYRMCSPSIDTGASTFTRQIDDYEVWNGMPSSSQSTSSTSSNNNNPPPPPGKPYVVD